MEGAPLGASSLKCINAAVHPMTEILNFDRDKARADPEGYFQTPADVLEHIALTRGQKIGTLQRWAFAVRARVDSVNEGMLTPPDDVYGTDVELLRLIERLILDLREHSNEVLPAEHGERLVESST